MDEIWKEINDCPNYYVSNAGEVARFIRGRLRKLKPHISVHGYIRYDISIEGHRRPKHISAHRLVAEAFIPNPDNLPYVNHKNEVKRTIGWRIWSGVPQNITLHMAPKSEGCLHPDTKTMHIIEKSQLL